MSLTWIEIGISRIGGRTFSSSSVNSDLQYLTVLPLDAIGVTLISAAVIMIVGLVFSSGFSSRISLFSVAD